VFRLKMFDRGKVGWTAKGKTRAGLCVKLGGTYYRGEDGKNRLIVWGFCGGKGVEILLCGASCKKRFLGGN